MKKQLTILTLLFSNCTLAWSQDKWIKTTTPCNVELLKQTPGRWLPTRQMFYAKTSKQEQQEMLNRLNTFHKFMFDLYPSPIAFDAQPTFSTRDRRFGYQLKFEYSANQLNSSEVNGTPTLIYSYTGFFCAYGCRNNNEIGRGKGCETGTEMHIEVNSLDGFLKGENFGERADIMVIDGRPIKMMPVLTGKWRGYDQYSPESGSGIKMVLLHREGILPYTPTTRKQYLDKSIKYLENFFADQLRSAEHPEGLNLLMDKKERDEQIKKVQKFRDDVLKYYMDELDATSKAGLLDSPAVIFEGMVHMLTQYPIFTTQANGGRLLVTENPAYMKKELPKYIPQFMYYTQWDCNCGADPSLNPYKLIDEKFPIEKLQAMIDK